MEFYDFFDDTTRNRIIELMDSVEKTYEKIKKYEKIEFEDEATAKMKFGNATFDRRTASINGAEYAKYNIYKDKVEFYDDMGRYIPNINI